MDNLFFLICRRYRKRYSGYEYSGGYSPRYGVSSFNDEYDIDMTRPDYKKDDFPIDDSGTSFSIPRPQYDKNGAAGSQDDDGVRGKV